jgi:hypothetical protein
LIDRRLPALLAVAFAAALALVAWASPEPDRVTDRGVYETTAARVIVVDCSDLQCFRLLVPWVLGRLPGPSLLRWKAYAVLSNAAAGAAVWMLCITFGLSRRVALIASVLSVFGFGSLYTMHDPFTSDPLMYALGPIITTCLLTGRFALAALVGVVGTFAKEFAAAPAYAFALYQALQRQWGGALRALLAANAAFLAWAILTLTLMLRFNYGWGWNGIGSANITGGAALALWAGRQSARGIAFAMFNEFGALYVLAPVGLLFASSQIRRLVLVSLPIAALFGYVQQPDRALWNFHYLVTPLAALVLARVPPALAVTTAVLFAIGNLRLGAQLPIASVSRVAIVASLVCAVISTVAALRGRSSTPWVAGEVAHQAGR